jgi:hypothetical protein
MVIEENAIDFLLNKATSSQRECFLRECLIKQPELLEKFRTYILGQIGAESSIQINEIVSKVKEKLENLDLTDEQMLYQRGLSSHSVYGYRDDDQELIAYGAQDIATDSIKPFFEDIDEKIECGNVVDAFKYFLGLFKGILIFEENEANNPEYHFYHGLRNYLIDDFLYYFRNFVDRFLDVLGGEDVTLRVADQFFSNISDFATSTDIEEKCFAEKVFKPLLIGLIKTPKAAKFIDSKLNVINFEEKDLSEIELNLNEMLGDQENWLKIAEKSFHLNPNICRKLLEYYHQTEKTKEFLQVCHTATSQWLDKFAEYLYGIEITKKDPDLFQMILTNLIKKKEDINLYREFKSFFSESKTIELLDYLESNYGSSLLWIKLMEEEKDYQSILGFVKKNFDSYDFIDFIRPILKIYPMECLEIIIKKTLDYLDQRTGRRKYKYVIEWLNLVNEISDEEVLDEFENFIRSLFRTFYNRPALKDELRRAGFINHNERQIKVR